MESLVIWDSFREGSVEALEVIYESHYSSMLNYGFKFLGDYDIVKDLIHELFLELINSGKRLSSTSNVRYYLLKALRYKIIKQASNNSFGDSNKDFSILDSVETKLIEKELEEEMKQKIIQSINKLSEKQQEIIYLRFYNDMSYSEIANLFDVRIQTVRNLMSRAIASLRQDLDDPKNGNLLLLVLHFA